jgi:hypothetical protein
VEKRKTSKNSHSILFAEYRRIKKLKFSVCKLHTFEYLFIILLAKKHKVNETQTDENNFSGVE